MGAAGRKPPYEGSHLAECIPVRPVHDGNAERAIVEIEDKVLPKVGLAASVRQQFPGAVELIEGRQLLVMVKNELGRPPLGLQIEAHRGQSPAYALNDVRSP